MKKQRLMVVLGCSLFLISALLLSGCQAAEVEAVAAQAPSVGVVYAMDAVDQKLFDSAERAMSTRAESVGAVYAMDAVDQKLFNATAGHVAPSAGAPARPAVPAAEIDDFDYAAAADASAARWQAMGQYYADQGLLTRDSFDNEQAANNMAGRWQAMAAFYEAHGLLNEPSGE